MGRAGAYPNVQMGISHTGVAYVKDGKVYNIDNPLNEEYLGRGMRAVPSRASTTARSIFIRGHLRRRNLRSTRSARTLPPGRIAAQQQGQEGLSWTRFKFKRRLQRAEVQGRKALEFVKHFGQIAPWDKTPPGVLDMYCSEFAWSLLALRDCDPADGDAFKGGRVPSCIKPTATPLEATGITPQRRAVRRS